jgi:hypothetical protein
MYVATNKVVKIFKFTWYISSPRAANCSSVLAAVNNALKVYMPEIKECSLVISTKKCCS